VPISNVTSVASSYYMDGWFATTLGALPSETTADNELLGACDYKCFRPDRNFNKYINVAKYFAKRDEKWLPVG